MSWPVQMLGIALSKKYTNPIISCLTGYGFSFRWPCHDNGPYKHHAKQFCLRLCNLIMPPNRKNTEDTHKKQTKIAPLKNPGVIAVYADYCHKRVGFQKSGHLFLSSDKRERNPVCFSGENYNLSVLSTFFIQIVETGNYSVPFGYGSRSPPASAGPLHWRLPSHRAHLPCGHRTEWDRPRVVRGQLQ